MTSAQTLERLSAICAEVGFPLARGEASLIERLRLLADHTETVADCERMVASARKVFRYYEATKPLDAFTESERQIVVLGCVFSDIGKTGPRSADASGQRLVVEMFAVEGVGDDQQTVAHFMKTYFVTDAEERLRRFAALGLEPSITIREFWNLHSTWTLEIMEAGGVPPAVVAAAATHHLLDNINPKAIVGADRRFTRAFGDNVAFDRAEKLIILLDKYDAVRRRGGQTHEQAIAWLRKRVASVPYFSADEELLTLIADLDAALQS
ncbi:MAG TPA: hypothetical protein VHP33_20075 [Polyangiaceae bacterium]|nr:hypothetical protein [Polyangiaceae bacterium]